MVRIKHTLIQILETRAWLRYFILAAITFLAFYLRLYKLGEWSFWIDEMYTIRDAFNHNTINILDVYQVRQGGDYGFSFISLSVLLIRAGLLTFGVSEWSARLFPAIIGALSIPILYLPVRKALGAFVSLLAVLLLALSPWHIQLSQNARYYSTFILFSTLALFVFYLAVEKNHVGYMVLSMGLVALATLERIHALFFLPVAAAYLMLLIFLPFGRKPAGLTPKNVLFFLGLPVVLYAGYELLYKFVLQRETFLSVFLSSKFLGLVTARPQWLLTGMLTDIGLPAVLLGLVGLFFLIRQRNRLGLLLGVGAFLPVMLLMALAPFFQTSIHYAIVSLLCWLVLAAVGAKELYLHANRTWGLLILTVVLIGVLVLFLRDRVIQDVAYYYWGEIDLAIYLLLAFMAGALTVLTAIRLSHWLLVENNHLETPDGLRRIILGARLALRALSQRVGRLAWAAVVLPLLILHPLITDNMYYQFQHGYRDNNWRDALDTVRREKQDGDLVLSAVPPVTSFYLGERSLDLRKVNMEQLLAEGNRMWVIDEYGATQARGETFETWLGANCVEFDVLDRYVRGRNWKMRVMLCEPGGTIGTYSTGLSH